MAFKGIDFAKLSREMDERRALPPEERAMIEAREDFGRSARSIAEDESKRSLSSQVHKVLTIAAEPYSRFELDGTSVTNLRFIDDDGQTRNAAYRQSEAERLAENARQDPGSKWQELGRLDKGVQVSVLGEMTKRSWRDSAGGWRSAQELTASRLEPGVHSRAELEALAATPMVKASLAYQNAKDEPSRQAIAREYLGQPGAVSIAKGREVPSEGLAPEVYRGR